MQLTATEGTALVIHDGALKTMEFESDGENGYVFFDDEDEIEALEYDERFDVYFESNDYGFALASVHVIATGPHAKEKAPAAVPGADAVHATLADAIAPLAISFAKGELHRDDLAFATMALGNPTWLHKAFAAAGDVATAQKNLRKEVFGR